jgi:glucokinase
MNRFHPKNRSIRIMTESLTTAQRLIGVEISRNFVHIICIGLDGEVFEFKTFSFDSSFELVPQIVEFIGSFVEKFSNITTIGVAISGLIDRKMKRVRLSPRNPKHESVDLVTEIENSLNLSVVLENDANAAAFGEFKLGAGRGSSNLFFATLGDGVGGAIILDGEMWRGVSGFAGEIGYTVIDTDETKLEDVASEAGIIRRIKNRLEQDHSSSLGSFDEITIADVVREASIGDEFAQMMLERTGSFVGIATANVINFLNVERIVFGGTVLNAENFVLDSIISSAKKLSFEPCFETTTILTGELGDKASAIGAALLSAEV